MITKYTYTISTQTASGKVAPGRLHDEIVAAGLPGLIGVRPGGADQEIVEFTSDLSAGDKTTLDGVMGAHTVDDLVEAKKAKKARIDARTEDLIRLGFTHASKVFSLSPNAQIYWSNLLNIPASEFPLHVNTLDDEDAHDIADQAEAAAVWASAMGTVKARLGSGTDLKDQVRAATTIAEVDAVTDSR